MHRNSDLDGTVDFAVKHKIPPNDTFLLLNLVDVFGKVEFDFPKHVLLYRGVELLDNFEENFAVLKDRRSVDSEPHIQNLLIIPICAVLAERCLFCVSLMLCRDPRREAPSYIGDAIAQRDIVDVDYLESMLENNFEATFVAH